MDRLFYRYLYGTKDRVKGSLGLGYRTFCLSNHCSVPWAGRAQQPSQADGLLCNNDLEVTAVLAAVGRSCCKKLTAGAVSGRPYGRCFTAASHAVGQHGALLSRLEAACMCGKNGGGSLSCARRTGSLPVVPCRQSFVMAL